jgi:general secretion pathway protein D
VGVNQTTYRALVRCCAAIAAGVIGVSAALALPRPAVAAPVSHPDEAATYTFAFHDAEIAQVAEAILGDALHVTYVVDPGVTGKMSFRIDRQLTRVQLLEAFEAALETGDNVLVRDGDSLIIKPRAKAKGSMTLKSAEEGAHGAGYETVAVPLAYAAPSEVAKALQALAPENMVVYVDDKQGLLILGGNAQELQAALETIRTFDRSGLENDRIRFFELSQAPADTVAGDLAHILEASNVAGVTVVPLKRLNGLFVFGRTTQSLDQVGVWIAKLDVPSKEKAPSLWVYHPKNVTAEALEGSLNSLLTGQSNPSSASTAPSHRPSTSGTQQNTQGSNSLPSSFGANSSLAFQSGSSSSSTETLPAPSPFTGSGDSGSGVAAALLGDDQARVSADKESNTVLILASPARWFQIQKMLEEIDRTPGQVMIEASILEVTLTDQLNLGVDWSTIGDSGLLNVSSINSTSGTIAASTPGFAITYLGKDIKAAVNALASKTTVEVISAPKIMALDNHPAKLDIGDQVPIVTQSGQSTASPGAPVLDSVDYRNTGIILDVTPRISGENRVTLDIDQEVSSVAQTTSSDINSPTIQQRKLSTTLALDSGSVIALGGLISSNRTVGDTGIPYVKDIPVLGALFKTTTKTGTRTELIVLLTAKIVRDQATSQKVMSDLLADMHEVERHGLLKP